MVLAAAAAYHLAAHVVHVESPLPVEYAPMGHAVHSESTPPV